jgi:D-sedoheptulose 7-phosphate isomerase
MLNDNVVNKHMDLLVGRYPVLDICRQSIIDAYLMMRDCYNDEGKLLIAGNGGSAADSEHIAGELMKSFKLQRNVPDEFADRLIAVDSVKGESLSRNLERGLPAIPLVAFEALSTAYINDVDGLGAGGLGFRKCSLMFQNRLYRLVAYLFLKGRLSRLPCRVLRILLLL